MRYTKFACILLSTASISLAGCASDHATTAASNTSVTEVSSSAISEKGSTALSKVSTSNPKKKQFDVNQIHTIRIQSTAAHITVIGDHQLSQAQYELIDGTSSSMETDVSGTINDNTLTIKLHSKQKSFINTDSPPSLIVRVPVKDYDTLEINNDFGKLSLESESGLYPSHLVVNGSASDISSSNVMGMKSTKLHTEFGKITFDLPEKLESLAVELSTNMGSITNNVELDGASTSNMIVSKKVKGHIGAANTKSPSLLISTQVGEIELNR
ncbi:hypothetical protein [Paenibacillus alvei]|uniref:hypothetical protein n=1 Tax=Paenibacillus alvei TaxID=44250 RepID=UPI00227F3DCE|nr:hypothetical protein [Paenibacillus alvei]